MYQELIADVANQVIAIAAAALASGVVTALLTQALKWKAIAIPASKYPVPVAAVLSILLSATAILAVPGFELIGAAGWIVLTVGTLFVAVQSYDIVHGAIKKVKENK